MYSEHRMPFLNEASSSFSGNFSLYAVGQSPRFVFRGCQIEFKGFFHLGPLVFRLWSCGVWARGYRGTRELRPTAKDFHVKSIAEPNPTPHKPFPRTKILNSFRAPRPDISPKLIRTPEALLHGFGSSTRRTAIWM